MMSIFIQMFRLLIPAALGWWMGRKFGAVPTLLAGLILATSCSLFGIWLLKNLAVDEITWKNRLAGWLLPWGYRIFPNSFTGIGVISAVVCVALVGFGLFLAQDSHPRVSGLSGNWDSPASTLLLFTSWFLYGAGFLFLLNQFSQYGSPSGSPNYTIPICMTIIALLISMSCGFRFFGYSGWSLFLSGGPLLLAIVGYGLFMAVILFGGRTGGWN